MNRKNLMELTKDLGSWGWWLNCLGNERKIENSKIYIYTDSLDSILKKVTMRVKGTGYEVGIMEILFDFDDSKGASKKIKNQLSDVTVRKDKEHVSRDSVSEKLPEVYRVSDTFERTSRSLNA